jgi:hypothetical protein
MNPNSKRGASGRTPFFFDKLESTVINANRNMHDPPVLLTSALERGERLTLHRRSLRHDASQKPRILHLHLFRASKAVTR